jgi:hypothetical protein
MLRSSRSGPRPLNGYATETAIDSVDCATNDAESVAVAWSRGTSGSRWARVVSGTMVGGPFEIAPCYGYPSYRPRIAWHPAGYLIASYNSSPADCAWCFHVFNPWTGTTIWSDYYWPAEQSPLDWDVEWNGFDAFVAVYRYRTSEATCTDFYKAIRVDELTGVDESSATTLGSWGLTPQVCAPLDTLPLGAVLTYSDNVRNTFDRLVLVTNRRTWWLTQDAGYAGSNTGYTAVPNTWFAGCEYWGPRYRAGHSYSDPGTGAGDISTVHRHWNRSSGAPYEVYSINSGYYPIACASSDTYSDMEVLVASVNGSTGGGVCWNLEPQD